jgi:hypothetical protein
MNRWWELGSRVRTAAHAATGEAEFLAQLHARGVVVRPASRPVMPPPWWG